MPLSARFISLGADCQPAHHIRRLTDRQTPAFFDWLMTPLDKVVPLIETAFSGVFDPQNIKWSEGPRGWTAEDQRFGVIARHNFSSREPGYVAAEIKKIRWMGAVFMDLLKGHDPLVFIRRWDAVDLGTSTADVKDVHEYLKFRARDCVFLYLQMHSNVAPIIERQFITCYNPPTEGTLWQGDDAAYDRNFALANVVAWGHHLATQPVLPVPDSLT